MPYAFIIDGNLATGNTPHRTLESVEFERGSLPGHPDTLDIVGGVIVVDAGKQALLTKDNVTQAIQQILDEEAQSRGYDNINSIGKYIGYDNAFRAECEALGAWAAGCWAKTYEIMADWQAGNISLPTEAEVVAALPEKPAG